MEAYVLSGAPPSLSPSLSSSLLHLSLAPLSSTHTQPLHPSPPSPPPAPPGRTPDRFTQLTHLTLGSPSSTAPIWELSSAPICRCHKSEGEKCARQRPRGREEEEEGSGEGRGWEGVVGEEEGVMASACSLGNLSNLESCQDTERLCAALPLPLPCVSALAHEWTRGRKSRKKWRGKQTERGCQCSLF